MQALPCGHAANCLEEADATGCKACITCGAVFDEAALVSVEAGGWNDDGAPGTAVYPGFSLPTALRRDRGGALAATGNIVKGLLVASDPRARIDRGRVQACRAAAHVVNALHLPRLLEPARQNASTFANMPHIPRSNWALFGASVVVITAREAGEPLLLESVAVSGGASAAGWPRAPRRSWPRDSLCSASPTAP